MKKLCCTLGCVLIIFGLINLLVHHLVPVSLVYFFGGGLLFGYGLVAYKVTNLVHGFVALFFAIPVIMIAFLAIYGSMDTTDFTEDVVFVLGAGLSNDQIRPMLEARLEQTLLYFAENPDAIFVVCGGYGADQTISEARAMADFLITRGIPQSQIRLEDQSTSTYENFRFALTILDEEFPDGFSSVVITNVFHQYRAGYLARHLDISPSRFAAPTPVLTWHTNYVREFLAVFNSWLFQT